MKEYWDQISDVVRRRKTPLILAVVAQASNIGIWVTQEGKTGYTVLDLIIAVIAAFSIDLIIVSTAFIEKRSQVAWGLAIATSIIALIFSALIAVYIFNDDPSAISIWSGLHISFPVLVFFYSWFLSITEHDDRDYALKVLADQQREEQLRLERQYEQLPTELSDYRTMIVRRLLLAGTNTSAIYNIIGGNKQRSLELIKTVQDTLDISVEHDGT